MLDHVQVLDGLIPRHGVHGFQVHPDGPEGRAHDPKTFFERANNLDLGLDDVTLAHLVDALAHLLAPPISTIRPAAISRSRHFRRLASFAALRLTFASASSAKRTSVRASARACPTVRSVLALIRMLSLSQSRALRAMPSAT